MTAAATVTRPVLYLVPRPGRGRGHSPAEPAPPPVRAPVPALPAVAAEFTARALGTMFAPVAARLAMALAERAPLLARRGRPETWAAAIAFLLAEEARLFEYDHGTTRTSFARELDLGLSTLRRRGGEIRAALHPLHLDLPEPEIE